MIYQYIFGRDISSGYKTIKASDKIAQDGEDIWQSQLNIDYNPPSEIKGDYPEPLVYYNIKNKMSIIGKIVYQLSQQRKNYMQHYYLIDDNERNKFLMQNLQFNIKSFKDNIDDAYTTDIDNQDIYNNIIFNEESAKDIINTQKISKKVLEIIIYSCFEAVAQDKRIFFINDSCDKISVENNLNLMNIIFSILPLKFKEKLGFITYYKHLISPVGKELRSDIRIIFTENSEQNFSNRNRVFEDGNYIFDFANNETAVKTENIIYYSLLEFLVSPFFNSSSIEEVSHVINTIIDNFTNIDNVNYNLVSVVYEILYKNTNIDFDMANILIDNIDILSDEIRLKFDEWILSDSFGYQIADKNINSILFKAYKYDKYKDTIAEYFSKKITSTKKSEYIDIIFDKQAPFKLMEAICFKLLNKDEFIEGGKFLIYNSINKSKDKNTNKFKSDKVLDILQYFCNFSSKYYRYFDDIDIYNTYIKQDISNLDIDEFKNILKKFDNIISNIENEDTINKFKDLRKMTLKKYILLNFDNIQTYENISSSIDICFNLINCAQYDIDYIYDDILYNFKKFSLNIVSPHNILNFRNIDYYFKQCLENYSNINRFLDIIEDIMIKVFNKDNLSTDEYNRLLKYADQLKIKIDVNKIKGYEALKFRSKLEKCMCYNDIPSILDLVKNNYIYLEEKEKQKLINWLKNGYVGAKNDKFFELIIQLYGDDYNSIFWFIDKDKTYEALKVFMKSMKTLGKSNNKSYIKYLLSYVKDNKKLKKYLKSLDNNQKSELGLYYIMNNKRDIKNNSLIPIICGICFILIVIVFIIQRNIDFNKSKIPYISINYVVIDYNGDLAVSNGAEDINIYDGSNVTVHLNINTDNDFTVNLNLNDVPKNIDDLSILKINSNELTQQDNKLEIITEDKSGNKYISVLNIFKQEDVNKIDLSAIFSSIIYNSKGEILSESTQLNSESELLIPEQGNLDLNFDIKYYDKCIINAKINDIDIPLKEVIFTQDKLIGKININYNDLSENNILIIKVYDKIQSKEYRFNIIK